MSDVKLIFLLGSRFSGIYDVADRLRKAGAAVGIPRPELENFGAVRHHPEHAGLWQWQALRRYFDDMGLPPIAPVPRPMLSAEESAYYVGLFARCLGDLIKSDAPYVYADHLAALAWREYIKALAVLNVGWKAWFFFSHPALEMERAKTEHGFPLPLTEFVWRNTVANAIINDPGELVFIDLDVTRPDQWRTLSTEISGMAGSANALLPAPEPIPVDIKISPQTEAIYTALAACAAGSGDLGQLRQTALEVQKAQEEQNGWQYFDRLDCGILDARAKRILAHAEVQPQPVSFPTPEIPEDAPDSEWLSLLDNAERRLLEQKRDFSMQLFLQNQSLRRQYHDALADMRQLHAQEIAAIKEKARQGARRRARRLRGLLKGRQGNC